MWGRKNWRVVKIAKECWKNLDAQKAIIETRLLNARNVSALCICFKKAYLCHLSAENLKGNSSRELFFISKKSFILSNI